MIKKYLYEITIGVLAVAVGVSSYYLYSGKQIKISNPIKTQEVSTPIDIKVEKNQTQKKMATYTPKEVDNVKVSEKLTQLKQMLSQTENMLREYNSKNKDTIIIKDEDINKLVSLDLQQSDTSQTTPLSQEDDTSLDTNQSNNTSTDDSTQDNSSSSTNSEASSSSSSYTTTSKTSSTSSSSKKTSSSNSASSSSTQAQNSTSNTTSSSSTEVSSQLNTLRTQIDEIKSTINEVSSNIK